jgi:hypothetical protein
MVQMLKKDLAEKLGISPSMVSRLAKRGMPTDSQERAQRWRRRHLEPGRTVGSRFDPARSRRKAQGATPGPAPAALEARPAHAIGCDLAHLLRVAELLGHCLETGRGELVGALSERLRAQLRGTPNHAAPALALRVWRALAGWALLEPPQVSAAPQAQDLTASEFAGLIALPWLDGAEVLNICRDCYGHSIPGLWPEDELDD